jgi:hypothetical protein
MSKHISRKQRWQQQTVNRHASDLGVVFYEQNGWYALLDYRLRSKEPSAMPVWLAHQARLGPFKRPRNAMVALEREAAMLKNRHEDEILLGERTVDLPSLAQGRAH